MTHPTDAEIARRVLGHDADGVSMVTAVRIVQETRRALLAEQARTEPDLAPGVMRCARCKFRLHRINLNVNVGTVTAGDNKTEPCPNGCGPLWPVTWKEEAEEAMAVAEGLCDRAVAAEKELADLRERLGPRAAPPLKAEQAKDAAEDAVLREARETLLIAAANFGSLAPFERDRCIRSANALHEAYTLSTFSGDKP